MISYNFSENFYQSKQYLCYKQKVLEPLGLVPDIIMECYKTGNKTIIIDLIESRRSVGSFVSLLIGAALQEQYRFNDILEAIGVRG